MKFYIFILLNALLFLRPADLIPELENAPLYEVVILVSLVLSAPGVLRQLTPRMLIERPVTAGMLGLWGSIVFSQLCAGSISVAIGVGVGFLKIVLYYLLLVAIVDSPKRLQRFVGWIALLILGLTTLALLQHHMVIDLPALAAIQQREVIAETGERFTLNRLCGVGIFNDPNDLSVILVVGMVICFSRFSEKGTYGSAWLIPLGAMGYALTLTHSRGGFLALLGAVAANFYGNFGFRRTLLYGSPVLIVLVAILGGRQTNFDLSNPDDTSQHRIKLWRDGMVLFHDSPFYGIGAGRYAEECGLVAHNSFVHAYTELGMMGGSIFLAAFVLPIGILHQGRKSNQTQSDRELRELRPCLMACTAGMVGGMLSLSRNYTLPPYLLLGMLTAYFALLRPSASTTIPRLDGKLAKRVVVLSILFLVGLELFVRTFASVGQ